MAYAIVGWFVMQIAATVVPALHLSDAITRAVVLLTLLGFPIALVLAWAFELAPDGQAKPRNVCKVIRVALTGWLIAKTVLNFVSPFVSPG